MERLTEIDATYDHTVAEINSKIDSLEAAIDVAHHVRLAEIDAAVQPRAGH